MSDYEARIGSPCYASIPDGWTIGNIRQQCMCVLQKKILVSPGRHTRMILLVVVLLLLGWRGGHVECSAVAWETLELEGYSMNRT